MSLEDMQVRFGRGVEDSVVQQSAFQMAVHLDAELPEGREKALALTKLEEALLWSRAAIERLS